VKTAPGLMFDEPSVMEAKMPHSVLTEYGILAL